MKTTVKRVRQDTNSDQRNFLFLFIFLLFFGFVLRLLAASFGYTYDLDSYSIVGKIITTGGNVYNETIRYNYGPLWFYVVGAVYKFSTYFHASFMVFRFTLASILAFVDIGICIVLYGMYGPVVSFLYYFNPISIIVTGYYSQFDSIAILLGLLAMIIYGKDGKAVRKTRKISGLVVLGLSLVAKHVFIFFPLWLAVRQKKMQDKILTLIIPVAVFAVSFLPFFRDGSHGIINNVFFYFSFKNAPLWNALMPDSLKLFINQYIVFFVAIALGAFIFRKKRLVEALAYYGAILVIFSPAMAEQYFIDVLPFVSLFFNPFFLLFSVIQTLFMLMVMAGGEVYVSVLRMTVDRHVFGFTLQIILLFAGLLYVLGKERMMKVRAKQWIVLLMLVNVACVLFVILPDRRENEKVRVIEQAIVKGDYERANSLYNETQVNPPFAGSSFWNKLTKSRYYIEYYRNYRKAKDIYADSEGQKDWTKITKYLKKMPQGFNWAHDVQSMLQEAQIHETGR
jgi:hypothetical protein